MEQENPRPEETLVTKVERRWLAPAGLAAGIFFVIIVIAMVFTVLTSQSLVNANKQADTSGAKTILKTAVAAASQYAVDNNNLYTEMKAGDLRVIESTIDWVDGQPDPGQVGILDTGEDTYSLVYLDSDGNEYHAKQNDQGKVVYTTADGKSF